MKSKVEEVTELKSKVEELENTLNELKSKGIHKAAAQTQAVPTSKDVNLFGSM